MFWYFLYVLFVFLCFYKFCYAPGLTRYPALACKPPRDGRGGLRLVKILVQTRAHAAALAALKAHISLLLQRRLHLRRMKPTLVQLLVVSDAVIVQRLHIKMKSVVVVWSTGTIHVDHVSDKGSVLSTG